MLTQSHLDRDLRAIPFFLIAIFASLLFWGECIASEPSRPSLESYPLKNKLWVNISKTQLTPAQNQDLIAPSLGHIKILVHDKAPLKKGQVWAILKPKRLELSHESLLLEEQSLHEALEKMDLDHEDRLAGVAEKLGNLDMEKNKLLSAANSQEVLSNAKLKEKLNEAITLLGADIKRMKKRHAILKQKTSHQTEISKLHLAFKKKKNEYADLKKSSEYTALFDGTLNLHLETPHTDKKSPATYWVEAGEPIATISNDKHYEASLPALSPHLSQLPKKSLFLVINPVEKTRMIHADYARSKFNPNNPTVPTALIFKIAEKDRNKVKPLLGSLTFAHVYTRFEKPCHIVPKSKLIKYFSDQSPKTQWLGLVKKIWPGSKLRAIGPHSLAIEAAPATSPH